MNSRLYWHIHQLSFQLEKLADEQLKTQLDIGFAQYKVLEAINHNSLAKQNVVARLLNQTEASISRQIKILQKKGLIEAREVMGNKRARELALTRVGEDVVRQADDVIEIAHADIIGQMSYQEQTMLESTVSRLLDRTDSKDKSS